jgi:DNA methylase
MFPEDFAEQQVLAHTQPNETVLDPFCGRGTAVFQSLLTGRFAAGVDINPVAACIAGAKANAPSVAALRRRLNALRRKYLEEKSALAPNNPFFSMCFHPRTLREIIFLRGALDWNRSRVDSFIAAVTLGCLHGESHRSPNYLSNRMPRTISTKPDHSIRWWSEHAFTAPERATFDVIKKVALFRLQAGRPNIRGRVVLCDARKANLKFPKLRGAIDLILTSPPYIDTTDYSEDQWLRLWFLGGPERPQLKHERNSDDRYTDCILYWKFLVEAWSGCSELVKRGTKIVVRIGGRKLSKDELFEGLLTSLRSGFGEMSVEPVDRGKTTAIRNPQTNAFRPGTSTERVEHDFTFALS